MFLFSIALTGIIFSPLYCEALQCYHFEEITRERDTRIAELEADLENVLRGNKDLLFSGYIKKVDYKGNGTQITFGIYSDEVPEQINKLKHILHNYQVTMIEK